jgi:hypothetical protein
MLPLCLHALTIGPIHIPHVACPTGGRASCIMMVILVLSRNLFANGLCDTLYPKCRVKIGRSS